MIIVVINAAKLLKKNEVTTILHRFFSTTRVDQTRDSKIKKTKKAQK